MKKFFFLALMAFLWLPATTWADEHNEDPTGEHSGNVGDGHGDVGDDVWDDEQEEELGKIVPSSVQLEYQILTAPQGNVGELNYVNGTVELDNIYSVTEGSSVGALYIPHEIQVVTVEGISATVNLYTVVAIGDNAFRVGEDYNQYNSTISSVSIPYSVTSIGDYAFADNTNISSIVFATDENGGASVTSIGQYAFYNNSGISTISLPTTATNIGEGAFSGSGITSIVLPDDLTTMSASLFRYCEKLTTVTSSGSITSLGADVFANCPNLTTLIFTSTNPSNRAGSHLNLDEDPFFDDSQDYITVYVPTGYAAAWEKTMWNNIFNNEEYAHISWNFNSIDIYYDSFDDNDEDNIYYATYYTDALGEFSSDVTPNIVTEAGESGAITYKEVSGVIPANTGLLLTASSSEVLSSDIATYYYHPYGVDDATASVDGNMLLGTNVEGGITTVGPGGETTGYLFYKLALDASETPGTIGFYWGASEGGQFLSAAGKAYLAVSSSEDGTAPTHYSFKKDEGDTTGISAVESASEKAVSGIYTIQGVRVNNMNQPGLYIVDGKKVLVK